LLVDFYWFFLKDCSEEIIFENSDTLFGLLPPPPVHPHSDNDVVLLPNPGHRTSPCSPPGDWWRKKGDNFFIKKMVFFRAKKKYTTAPSGTFFLGLSAQNPKKTLAGSFFSRTVRDLFDTGFL
jgi:hypothetical protein